jgi:hypothetical protein
MKPIHTHYDNLKVVRNAPPEVIRAAYKTLSQKFHPDRNPGNPDAARIMSILNGAYEILSDHQKRADHDLWIEQQEQASVQSGSARPQEAVQPATSPTPSTGKRSKKEPATILALLAHVLRYWKLYLLLVGGLWLWTADRSSSSSPSQLKPSVPEWENVPAKIAKPAKAMPSRQVYERPILAPTGEPWPASAAYLKDYKQRHTDGLSTVTVDNSRNNSDVFVKLVSLNGSQAYPARLFFIPAFSKFTLSKVTAGNYDIRYRDLDTGGLSRSEPFNLEETATYNGTQFSNLTMTLYKVQNGNMRTYSLAESEF